MYLKDRGLSGPVEVAAPTSTSGLYIYPRGTRKGGTEQEAVKVSIPPDCLGEQLLFPLSKRKRAQTESNQLSRLAKPLNC